MLWVYLFRLGREDRLCATTARENTTCLPTVPRLFLRNFAGDLRGALKDQHQEGFTTRHGEEEGRVEEPRLHATSSCALCLSHHHKRWKAKVFPAHRLPCETL